MPDSDKKGRMVLYGREFDSSYKLFSKCEESTQLSASDRTGKEPYQKEYRKAYGFKQPDDNENPKSKRH